MHRFFLCSYQLFDLNLSKSMVNDGPARCLFQGLKTQYRASPGPRLTPLQREKPGLNLSQRVHGRKRAPELPSDVFNSELNCISKGYDIFDYFRQNSLVHSTVHVVTSLPLELPNVCQAYFCLSRVTKPRGRPNLFRYFNNLVFALWLRALQPLSLNQSCV